MANGFGSFYVGSSGLNSAQNALNVTANNLANVDTKGYVREQVRFSDQNYLNRVNPTTTKNIQQTGLGVSISDVAHARDIFLDKAYRQETGRQSFYSNMYSVTEYVEDLLQEMNGKEFKDGVSDLWKAFQEYAKDPSNSTNQNLVVQKSEVLLSRAQAVYGDLQKYQANLNLQIKQTVDRVNEIGNRIYDLNLEIQKVEAGGVETAMTARDERDLLIDELASYAKIDVTEDATGFTHIKLEGMTFLESNRCNEIGLKAERGSGFYTPYWPQLSSEAVFTPVFTDIELPSTLAADVGVTQKTNISTELNNDIGGIKALLIARGSEYGTFDFMSEENYSKVADCTVMETEAQISYLVRSIAKAMNDIFCPNTTYTAADGKEYTVLDTENCSVGSDKKLPPQELFVRDGYQRYTKQTIDGKEFYVYNEETSDNVSSWYMMGNMSVNPALRAQVTKMPSFKQNGEVDYSMGDKIKDAWENEGMRIIPSDSSPCTFEGYYDKLIDRLGTSGNIYKASADTMESTVNAIDNQRQQVMGVSSEEELTKMIKYQSAYNASSRYITVISDMTELIVTGLI